MFGAPAEIWLELLDAGADAAGGVTVLVVGAAAAGVESAGAAGPVVSLGGVGAGDGVVEGAVPVVDESVGAGAVDAEPEVEGVGCAGGGAGVGAAAGVVVGGGAGVGGVAGVVAEVDVGVDTVAGAGEVIAAGDDDAGCAGPPDPDGTAAGPPAVEEDPDPNVNDAVESPAAFGCFLAPPPVAGGGALTGVGVVVTGGGGGTISATFGAEASASASAWTAGLPGYELDDPTRVGSSE